MKRIISAILIVVMLMNYIDIPKVQAESLDIDLSQNPITDVVATRESVILLHKDTSVSGFGSNVANVLGMTGGVTQNTGDLTKISDPTGIAKLVAGADNVMGLIEDENDATKYSIVKFNENIGNDSTRWKATEEIKDFAMAGTADSNPHQCSVYVDINGNTRVRGSDYGSYLGTGNGQPYGAYPGGSTFVIDNSLSAWAKALAPDGEPILYPQSGTGWLVSNENNSNDWTDTITPAFDISREEFTLDINYRGAAMHPDYDRARVYYNEVDFIANVYDGNLTDEQIQSGDYAPIKSNLSIRPAVDGRSYRYYPIVHGLDINEPQKFKLKISSRYTKWDLRIRDRIYFENAAAVVQARSSGHSYCIVNNDGEVFINAGALVKKVTLPSGVKIDPTTLTGATTTRFAALDTDGEMWIWTAYNNATKVEFEDEGTMAFYEKYSIKDIALGEGFYMVLTKNKSTAVTNVWVWGSNTYGELGMGEPGTVIKSYKETGEIDEVGNPILEETETIIGASILTPTKVMRVNGTVLTNIQAIAAGRYFSVIVQNTSDGQLVWTSGYNNSGQLGGGVTLVTTKPTLVPGTSNIDRIYPVLSEILMFNDTDKKVLTTGAELSYVRDATLHSGVTFYPTQFYVAEYKINTPMYTHAVYVGEDGVGKHTRTYDGHYNTSNIYNLTVDVGNRYLADGTTEYLDYTTLNNGESTLKNIQKAVPYYWGTIVLDSTGRVWSAIDNSWTGANYVGGQGGAYNSAGEFNPYGYPGRGIGRAPNLRPARVDFNTIEETKFIDIASTTKITTTNVTAVAVSEDRNLYKLSQYSSKLDIPAINGKADKLYSTFNAVYLTTTDGLLYTWGNNGSYRMGTGNNSSYSTPQLIPGSYFNNEQVIDVTSNDYVTLFLTVSGNVYASGTNYYSLFAEGDLSTSTAYSSPTLLTNLSGLNLTSIKLGEKFGAGLDADGRVWSWGYGAEGSLGDNFTSNRNFFSTAVGNDLPQMTLLDTIQDRYYSVNSIYPDNKNISINASVVDPDFETTTVYANMFGKKSTVNIASYASDVYDKPVPKDIKLSWKVVDTEYADDTNALQSLTKITTEDSRGGLIEQFLSSNFIIDNETPKVPEWDDVYIVNDEDSLIQLEVNSVGKYASTSDPIRITTNLTQKTGQNRAPVYIQYQYRQKQTWGYTQWDDADNPENWHTIEGNTMEFFAGFQGETEIRIRAIDAAGNVSSINPTTKKIIIDDAGPVISSINAKTYSEDNVLRNDVIFNTTSKSTRVSYTVNRKGSTEVSWTDLTEEPPTLPSGEVTFKDIDLNLIGNETYTYSVTGENITTTGTSKEVNVVTYPYSPKSMTTSIADDKNGINFLVDQDSRNIGTIKYRLVIEESSNTSNQYYVDLESSNKLQTLIYQVKQEDVDFTIINNPINIKILYKGSNGEWLEKKYNQSETIMPVYAADDKTGPTVSLKINTGATKISNSGTNKVTLQVVAVDDYTDIEDLQMQFSTNGVKWLGQNKVGGVYTEDVYSSYALQYENFELGSETGRKVVYARAKDQTGNFGYAFAEIYVVNTDSSTVPQPTVNSGSGATTAGGIGGVSTSQSGVSVGIETGSIYGEEYIYLKASQVQVKVSDYFTIDTSKEVQYSTDGVSWSEWELGIYFADKELALSNVDGLKAIFVRQRDSEGTVSNASKVKFVLDTTPPVVNIKSGNLSYIAVDGTINLEVEISDNILKDIPFTVVVEKYEEGDYTQVLTTQASTGGEVINKVALSGLSTGRIKITV
ncbi:MAG TPA: hypothetical protein DEG71_06960, partial [Clostridiales bacterium]|nr:hypothetical protein [Clostridiales bacterium]